MSEHGPAGAPLEWDVFIKRRESATRGLPPGKEALSWVSNSVTLIWGERDAVLVDTFLGEEQTRELIGWIDAHERNLATIYITHGHADHFFGLKTLLDHYPRARAIAAAPVVSAMQAAMAQEKAEGRWSKRFPGQIPAEIAAADVLDGDSFQLEGHELRIIDTGHTDTDHTTALHAPSIGLVVAGDAIYNETHPFLAESDAAGRRAWRAAIDRIDALTPKAVVVGHGPMVPDCSPRHIAATRKYLRDFERLDAETTTARELYDRMLALYPDRINPGSLWAGAHKAKNETW